jgi:hypothetical protein
VGVLAAVGLMINSDEIDSELMSMKYPFVMINFDGWPPEKHFDMLCWLEDNVGEDDYWESDEYANAKGDKRIFFTHSNDAMTFKLAYGYE